MDIIVKNIGVLTDFKYHQKPALGLFVFRSNWRQSAMQGLKPSNHMKGWSICVCVGKRLMVVLCHMLH